MAPPPSDQTSSPVRFTTRDLPGADQFAAWRDLYANTFDIRLTDPSVQRYPADYSSWDIDGLTISRASMPGGVPRQWQHFQKPPTDHWLLVVVPVDARSSNGTDPKHIGVRSLARPFEGVGSDAHVVTLFLPRDEFRDVAPCFDRAPEQIAQVGLGALVADFLTSLEQTLPSLSSKEMPGLKAAIKALVSALIAPEPDRLEMAGEAIASALVQRAGRVVRANMGLPEFGPNELASILCVSRSRLYRAFEGYGGVAKFIQEQRLIAAHRRLVEDRRNVSVNALSLELGFADHSTFSRAFRRRFGYSPREAAGT